LWIDALCIIQDDEYDWQVESSKMVSVHRDSYVTIAAVSSAGGSGGCFSSSNSSVQDMHELNCYDEGRLCKVFVRKSLGHAKFMETFISGEEIDQPWINEDYVHSFPLFARG
jgi:hypothetical protein